MLWLVLCLLVAMLAMLALVALRFARRQRQWAAARPDLAVALRHPVVLAHGLCGFDELGLPGLRQQYFRGVKRYLESIGVTVHVPSIPPLASVPERAARLAGFVRDLEQRVILVGHSMGGLDSRYAVAKLGLAELVECVVTIGTPHRGTPLARVGQAGVVRAVRAGWAAVGVGSEALDWLTPEAMAAFNEDVVDASSVRYYSVVGGSRAAALVAPPLRLPHVFIRRVAGANDGLVPVDSQGWGEVLLETPADHLAQIGWGARFDALAFYGELAAELERRGH